MVALGSIRFAKASAAQLAGRLSAFSSASGSTGFFFRTPSFAESSCLHFLIRFSNSDAGSAPGGDWIELHNTTAGPIDVSGWYLSDSSLSPYKYQLRPGTVIPAGQYLVPAVAGEDHLHVPPRRHGHARGRDGRGIAERLVRVMQDRPERVVQRAGPDHDLVVIRAEAIRHGARQSRVDR